MKAKKARIVCFSVVAAIMVIVLVLNVACGMLADTITAILCSTPLNAEARAEGEALAAQIEEEGIVMVRNENDSLPLDASVTKVNVFGWSATQWIVGGSGSGRVLNWADNALGSASSVAETDLLKALSDYGIEYNTQLIEMYKSFKSERPNIDVNLSNTGALHNYPKNFSVLYEPKITDRSLYTQAMLDYADEYSETAIVVLGRITGESNDCPQTQFKVNQKNGSPIEDKSCTYLDISQEEYDLLEYVADTHDNVVVIVNATNAMNLNFLVDIPNLNSCLLVGATGINAASVIPKVLYGEASPSGRTTDTYAYDFATNASYANSGANGVGSYTGSKGYYPADGTKNPNVGDNPLYDAVSYLDYVEGIYVGYKWYETADAEGYWDDYTSDYGSGYEGAVQYPFGFGLDYTDFEWDVYSVSPAPGSTITADTEITVTVNVTNTGDMPAKEVLQLYYTPEYTGGIEKAYVNLCAFEKTITLYPESQANGTDKPHSALVDLKFKASDMASYDEGLKIQGGGYILEGCKYEIKLMTDSHTLARVKQGDEAVITYEVAEDIEDPTGEGASNLFIGENADNGVSIDGTDTDEKIKYLSRKNFAETFPHARTADRAYHQKLKDSNLFDNNDAAAWLAEQGDVTMPNYGAEKQADLQLYDEDGVVTELGLELGNPDTGYDDSRWEQVLDQITLNEMKNLTLHGYIKELAVPSVGKPKTNSYDGPAQVGSFNLTNTVGTTGFPNATVLAQTWNKELAKSFGAALGKEAGELNLDGGIGEIEGLYATGLNLHRSPFGGRNYEYYSEDSFLSGILCANTIKGALSEGVYTYLKHFVVYEQESQRDSIYHWMTEQTLRETYLKPFKIVIDEGGSTALMSSYGRIGSCWTGGSQALLTDLLREEWGFKGTVITDYADHHSFMNGDQMIRAGGDLWMDGWAASGDGPGTYKMETSSPAMVTALRNATKNILYTGLNAQYMSGIDLADPELRAVDSGIPWWIFVLVGVDVVAVGGCALWVVLTIRKKNPVAEAEANTDTNQS